MVAITSVAQLGASLLLFSVSSNAIPTPSSDTSSVDVKNISTCGAQGTADSSMHQRHVESTPSFIGCQDFCFADSVCQTYSYDPETEICTTYMSAMAISVGSTGTYFSKKFPGDDSNFCYGETGY